VRRFPAQNKNSGHEDAAAGEDELVTVEDYTTVYSNEYTLSEPKLLPDSKK
jgi:hypothetical protein